MTRHILDRFLLLAGVAYACLSAGCVTTVPSVGSAPFEYTLDQTYPLPATGVVRLISEDAQVSLSGSDREDVRIEVHYRISAEQEKLARFTYRVSAVATAGELVVTEERQTGSRNFDYNQHVHTIKIELPRRAHVSVREEDGTCAIRDLDGRVHLTMDDGNAHLENCSGDITIAIDDGHVTQINCAALKYERR